MNILGTKSHKVIAMYVHKATILVVLVAVVVHFEVGKDSTEVSDTGEPHQVSFLERPASLVV